VCTWCGMCTYGSEELDHEYEHEDVVMRRVCSTSLSHRHDVFSSFSTPPRVYLVSLTLVLSIIINKVFSTYLFNYFKIIIGRRHDTPGGSISVNLNRL
jgi:hypothetical protein